jgi:uncharacterized protein YndB with AHSA1/START domain
MSKKIFIAAVVIFAALLGYAATRPDTFRVERTAGIKAPPEQIFRHINDFHRWSEWSPWEKLDPDMKRNYGGLVPGVGSSYSWSGNDKVGAGRMEILTSEPPLKIIIKLDFARPFEGHNTAEFTLAGKGDVTEVTWAMYGPSPYAAKLIGLVFSMDRMVGKDFDAGLANLKAVVEK